MGKLQLLQWNNILITEDTIKQFKCYLNKEKCTGNYSTSDMEEKFL